MNTSTSKRLKPQPSDDQLANDVAAYWTRLAYESVIAFTRRGLRHGDPGAPTAHPQYARRVAAVRLRRYAVHSPMPAGNATHAVSVGPRAQARIKREPPVSRIPQNRDASGLRL